MRVYCVDDDWREIDPVCIPKTYPVKGCVYTVTMGKVIQEETFYRLAEIDGRFEINLTETYYLDGEHIWNADHFRPVRETDIEELRRASIDATKEMEDA